MRVSRMVVQVIAFALVFFVTVTMVPVTIFASSDTSISEHFDKTWMSVEKEIDQLDLDFRSKEGLKKNLEKELRQNYERYPNQFFDLHEISALLMEGTMLGLKSKELSDLVAGVDLARKLGLTDQQVETLARSLKNDQSYIKEHYLESLEALSEVRAELEGNGIAVSNASSVFDQIIELTNEALDNDADVDELDDLAYWLVKAESLGLDTTAIIAGIRDAMQTEEDMDEILDYIEALIDSCEDEEDVDEDDDDEDDDDEDDDDEDEDDDDDEE